MSRTTIPDTIQWPTGKGIRLTFDPHTPEAWERWLTIQTEPSFYGQHDAFGAIMAYWVVAGEGVRKATLFHDLWMRQDEDANVWEIAQIDLRLSPALLAEIDDPSEAFAETLDGVSTFDLPALIIEESVL